MIDALSWIACLFSVCGKVAVNHKRRSNFVFFLCGYVAWVTWNVLTRPNPPMIVMYCVYTALTVRGWFMWRRDNG